MHSRMKYLSSALQATFAAAALAMSASASGAAADWQPTRPVEMVNPAGAGGASDQMARLIASIIQKQQLIKQPVIVQIKSGSSGAEGAMDVQDSKGNPHKMLVAFSLIYTLPYGTNLSVKNVQTVDGTPWLLVVTDAGQEGWVHGAYLSRAA